MLSFNNSEKTAKLIDFILRHTTGCESEVLVVKDICPTAIRADCDACWDTIEIIMEDK